MPDFLLKDLQTIETERLLLRMFNLQDAPLILDLLNQPSFITNIGDRGVRNLADAEEYIKNGPLESYEQNGFGLLMVELRQDRNSLGMCGLIRRKELEDVDIGFAFLPRYWGKGYADESARAVLTFARQMVRLKRVVAIVSPSNQSSIRLLTKIGMSFEKKMPWPADGSQLDVYGIQW